MQLENAQLLCTSVRLIQPSMNDIMDERGYCKSVHEKHPCQNWIQESSANFQWLVDHAFQTCNVWFERKGTWHKNFQDLFWCDVWLQQNKKTFPNDILTVPRIAWGDGKKPDRFLFLKQRHCVQLMDGQWRANSWDDCVEGYRSFIGMKVFAPNTKVGKANGIGRLPTWVNGKPSWYNFTGDIHNYKGKK